MSEFVTEPESAGDALAFALDLIERGGAIDEAGAAALFDARGDDLDRLLTVASALRDDGLERSGRTSIITYSKKVFVPITHLCQDRCHYCIFVETPGKLAIKGKPMFMSPEDILEVARAGAALGCKEALFTLGDRPENRWPAARDWLTERGYASTLEYIRAMAILVMEETGLLPHLNPGVMSWSELQALRPVSPSMGMMLETTATRLWSEKGGVHFGSPDKDPAIRLRVLEDAGAAKVPFTTGVLLGIGENNAERAEALFAIRASHERHGHIQETIVQNFRAKPRTAMQNEADLALQEYAAAVAVARVVMGADATIQAPPNLTDTTELGLLIRAGIDDWGGVSPLTADHVNPERPWPQLDELAELTRLAGYTLKERLTAHPQYITNPDEWIDERLRDKLAALAEPSGLANETATVVGRPWSFPSRAGAAVETTAPAAHVDELHAAIRRAEVHPAGLSDADYVALLGADGAALDELTALADSVRHSAVGDAVSFVINRNLDSALYSPGAGPDTVALTPSLLTELAVEAVELGATEICVQGAVSAELPGSAYFDVIRAIRSGAPNLHLHAYRPAEIVDGAGRTGLSVPEFLTALREAGVDTVPGTGARILDDDVRSLLSAGTELSVADWTATVIAEHTAGFRSTATMVYGHVESPQQQVAHLRSLAAIQDRTAGFGEFIAMPFSPLGASPRLVAAARPGPSLRETRAVHAVARLALHGRIDHVQAAWTKLGLLHSQVVLTGGADDFGGLLLDGTLWPEAGAEAHRSLTIGDVERTVAEIGRPVRQRLTDYSDASAEQIAFARRPSAPPPTRLLLPLEERRSHSTPILRAGSRTRVSR